MPQRDWCTKHVGGLILRANRDGFIDAEVAERPLSKTGGACFLCCLHEETLSLCCPCDGDDLRIAFEDVDDGWHSDLLCPLQLEHHILISCMQKGVIAADDLQHNGSVGEILALRIEGRPKGKRIRVFFLRQCFSDKYI